MFTCAKVVRLALLTAAVTALSIPALAEDASAAAAARLQRPASLYLTVEKGDKLVEGLGPENFRLSIDGQALPVRLEKPETPISIALLVEYSQASYWYFNDISAAMQGFFDEAPQGNWYALATFSHSLHVDVDFTKMTGRIVEAFSSLGSPMWDEADTYDAVYKMLDTMGRLPGRRVLIVIGSGIDTLSEHTLDDVLKKTESVNVTVYGVGAGSALRGMYEPYLSTIARMNLLQSQAFLQGLAEKSGGQAWFPNQESAYQDIMKGIVQSLHNQYRLVSDYHIPQDGQFHKLKVEAFQVVDDHRKDFKVRVRQGWRFEP